MQTCRQRIDVCALGLLCVPQPNGDQTQPVVATPKLGDGRLFCSCRSCPSLRLRGRSSFRLGHRADLPDGFPGGLVQRKYATLVHALKVQLGAPASTKGSIVSHVPSSRLEGSFDSPRPSHLPRTLRWPTTTDVKVAIESRGSSPTSAEAPRRRLAQGLAGSPVTCLPRHARRKTAREARDSGERSRVALPVCFGAGC